MSLPMPRLSIVIVTYNSQGHIDGCLASLMRTPPRIDHEIVVVDNASTDGTADVIRTRWPAARLIEAGSNVGFARANNIGFRQTFGELVLLLNPDTSVPAGAIDGLVAALDARPDAAVAGPQLVDAEGRVELSFGAMMSPVAELRQKLLVKGHARRIPLMTTLVDRMTRRARDVDWVSGACLLTRRTDAEAVGLMDERYFMYTEDVDFCAAIRARGRKVIFAPQAQVKHLRGQSRATERRATEAAYRQSQVAFYEKHHPGWAPLLRAYLKVRGR
jgi:hypothetical protein